MKKYCYKYNACVLPNKIFLGIYQQVIQLDHRQCMHCTLRKHFPKQIEIITFPFSVKLRVD